MVDWSMFVQAVPFQARRLPLPSVPRETSSSSHRYEAPPPPPPPVPMPPAVIQPSAQRPAYTGLSFRVRTPFTVTGMNQSRV